jgi:hypothetical protein
MKELNSTLSYQFIQDPRSKELNAMTKFAGSMFTAVVDYAKDNDISKMTLDDVFDYCFKIQKGSTL